MPDLSLPGYKYLGPGNPLDKGIPNNESDAVAEKHDYAYDAYTKQRYHPYLQTSKADDDFIRNAGNDYGGILGKTYFGLKKAALTGIPFTSIPDSAKTNMTGKRLGDIGGS